MFAGLLENGPPIKTVADVLAAFKKMIPAAAAEAPHGQLQKELERIALSAPHILSDIGFERDVKASSSERAVWRRDTHCVVIFSPKHAAAFV